MRSNLSSAIFGNEVLFNLKLSGTLDFTVEKSTKSLIDSGISGKGLVNKIIK